MNRTFLIIIGLTAAVTVGGGIIGARTLMKPKFEPEQSETVSRGDVEISVAETGTIESLRKVEVKSKVGGRISKLSVDAGQSVSAGQVLATIDSKEINSQVAALQAQLSGAKARLEAARTSAAYQAAQTINGIAQYEHAVQAAKARLLQAEAEASVQPQLTAHSIEGAAAGLDSAKAQVKAQRDNLNLMVRSTHTQAVVNAQSAYDQAVAQAENAAKHMRRQQNLLANLADPHHVREGEAT